MNWEAIRTNLATSAVIAVLSVATGYLFGTNQTAAIANDVAHVKGEVVTLKSNDKSQREFLNCVQLALQTLSEGVRKSRVCELRVE